MTTSEQALAADFPPASQEAWLRLVEKVLKGADFDKRLVQRTADGIRIEPLYARARAGGRPWAPLARTSTSSWQMCQLCIEVEPSAANAAMHEDLAAGADAVAIRMAAPGQSGLAADLEALSTALAGVPLDKVTIVLRAGESALSAAGALADLWGRQATPMAQRRAAFNLDPIGDLARLGGAGEPLTGAMARAARLAGDPRWRGAAVTALCADGRPCHEAGGSEAQELAFMLASAVTYLRAMEAAGLAPVEAMPRLSFSLAVDADLFLSIAKLRAARRLIGRLGEVIGAGAATSNPRLDVTTSERMMSRRDPWVNLLRTCAAGMAGALAGANAMTILPFTWAVGRPDAFARRIARNTHIVLREESGLGRVADPAGGSWHIEALTADLASKAWSEFQAIEAAGGSLAALQSGFVSDRVAAVAGVRAKAIATGRQALTGVSAFPRLGPDGVDVAPHVSAAVPVGGAVRVPALTPIRLAAPFEALRDRAEAYADRTGQPARVFLASLGTTAEHSARSTWIANFLAAGGIEAVAGDGFTNSADAGRAYAASGAAIACICSSDQVYGELAEATAGVLKQAGASKVLLAGRPSNEAELKSAGVDAFVFAGQDAVATLTGLQADLGIR